MGGGQSIASTYRGVYNLDPTLTEFKSDFERICLKNSDVKCLYDVYHKIDNAKNNAVEIDAIFLQLEISNEFIRKLFIYTLQLKQKEYNTSKGTVQSDNTITPLSSYKREDNGGGSGKSLRQDKTSDSCTISFDIFVLTGKYIRE